MKKRRLASVDHRPGETIVFSMSQTTDRYWINNDWYRRVDDSAGDAELGDAVRAAWDNSQQGVPDPEPGERFSDAVARELGAESYQAYADTITTVNVESDVTDAEVIYVTPHASGTDGFTPMTDRETTHGALGATELGSVVRQALAIST